MRRALPWLPGTVLLVTGTAVYLITGRLPRRFVVYGGSHEPLPGSSSWTVGWTAGQLVGAGLAVLGLLVLAVVAGRRLGRRARSLALVAGVLGGAAGSVGVALFWLANTRPAAGDVGWFAYSPLSAESSPAYTSTLELTFDDTAEVVLWSGQHALGAGLAVLGVTLLAGAAGWLSAHRAADGGAA